LKLLLPRLDQAVGSLDLAVQSTLHDGELSCKLQSIDIKELQLLDILRDDRRRRPSRVQSQHQAFVRSILFTHALLDQSWYWIVLATGPLVRTASSRGGPVLS
jgi:hypothetical protein